MDFQTPKHSVDCCIRYFCCTCLFKQSFTNNACSRILLLVVICSNALSILFSCITIYENRAMSNVMIRNAQKRVEEYILYSLYNSKMTATPAVPRKIFFAICESISYISFLFFIISLTAYAIYKIYTQL